MTHLIERTAGQWSFARSATADPAWHDGIVNAQVVPITATPAEWADASGLNYRFDRFELHTPDGAPFVTVSINEGAETRYFGHRRTFESGPRLGETELIGRPVTAEYEAVQPAQIFAYAASVCDAAASMGIAAGIAYAGSVGWGNRQFVTVEIPALTVVGETLRRFVSMISSIDGGLRFGAVMSEVATVCNNTIALNAAVADMIRGKSAEAREWGWLGDGAPAVGAVQLLHTLGVHERIKAALTTMEIALGWGDRIDRLSAELAARQVTDADFLRIVQRIWGAPSASASDGGKTRRGDALRLERMEALQDAWAHAKVERGGPTGWSAVQAITWVGSHQSVGSMRALQPGKALSQQFMGAGTELPGQVAKAVGFILGGSRRLIAAAPSVAS